MAAGRVRTSPAPQPQPVRFLFALVLIVGTLYVGKPVVVPLALAVLLTFILTPMVVFAQRRGLPRVPAVLLVVLLTLTVLGAVGWGVGAQMTRLAEDLPAHAGQVHDKIARLRSSGAGPFSRLFSAFQNVGETEKKPPAPLSLLQTQVVVAPAESSAMERLGAVASAVLEPVADAALIAVLVIFMLIRREDLRNRVIGLLGHGRLTGTTRVLVQSAQRISRLLLMQVCVNAGFGVVFGFALFVIGVQYSFLWGFLTVVLRFVPYVGSWMAAAFPVLLSFAMAPGLGQPFIVLGVFIVLDLLTANALEPLLFGHSTGVSPVALLVAAVFWTWVWGPIGLVLSTPLTVCLVVLGQHVPRFRFLSLLLGDQPALAPHIAFYQRLLAADRDEAMQIARTYSTASGSGTGNLADDVLVQALRLARRDRAQQGLAADDENFIYDVTQAVVDHSHRLKTGREDANALPLVLGCPAHHRAEELALKMLAGTLSDDCRMETISTRTLPSEIEARVQRDRPAVVVVAVMPPGGISQARYLCRRLSKRFPELKIVVGYFGRVRDFDRLLVRLRSSGANYVTTSVLQSRGQVLALLPVNAAVETSEAASAAVPTANAV